MGSMAACVQRTNERENDMKKAIIAAVAAIVLAAGNALPAAAMSPSAGPGHQASMRNAIEVSDLSGIPDGYDAADSGDAYVISLPEF